MFFCNFLRKQSFIKLRGLELVIIFSIIIINFQSTYETSYPFPGALPFHYNYLLIVLLGILILIHLFRSIHTLQDLSCQGVKTALLCFLLA